MIGEGGVAAESGRSNYERTAKGIRIRKRKQQERAEAKPERTYNQ